MKFKCISCKKLEIIADDILEIAQEFQDSPSEIIRLRKIIKLLADKNKYDSKSKQKIKALAKSVI